MVSHVFLIFSSLKVAWVSHWLLEFQSWYLKYKIHRDQNGGVVNWSVIFRNKQYLHYPFSIFSSVFIWWIQLLYKANGITCWGDFSQEGTQNKTFHILTGGCYEVLPHKRVPWRLNRNIVWFFECPLVLIFLTPPRCLSASNLNPFWATPWSSLN